MTDFLSDDALLKNLVPLNTLSEEQLGQLLSRITFKKVKRGSFLFREGDTDHHNIYLLEGRLALMSGSKEVDTIISGTQTARFAVAHQQPRKYSAYAKTDLTYVRVDSRLLSDLLTDSQSSGYVVNELGVGGKSDWMTMLLQSSIFQQIPPANLQKVMMLMQEVAVSAEDVIVQQGREGEFYYLISRGMCRVTRQPTPDRPPVELAQLKAGQWFGEESLVSGGPSNSTVTMLTDGSLVRLDKENFDALVKAPLLKPMTYEEAEALTEKEGVLVDIRAPEVFELGHLPGAFNQPFFSLRFQLSGYSEDRTYVVYADELGQAASATFLLIEHGLDAYVLGETWGELTSRLDADSIAVDSEDISPSIMVSSHDMNDDQAAAGEQAGTGQTPQNPQESYEQKLNQYQTELKLLKQALSLANRKLDDQKKDAKANRESFDTEVEELKASLAMAQDRATAGVEEVKADHQLEGEMNGLRKELNRIKEELVVARTYIEQSEETKYQLEGQVSELRQQLSQQGQLYKGEISTRNTQIEDLKVEIQSLEARIDKKQEHSKELKESLKAEQNKIIELQAEYEASEKQQALLTTELETLRSQREPMDEGTTQGQLEAIRDELSELKSQFIEREKDLDKATKKVVFLEHSLETAESAVEISEDSIEQAELKAKQAKEQIQLQADRIEQLEEEQESTQSAMSSLQKSYEDLQQSQQDLQDKHDQELEELESRLETDQAEHQKVLEQADQKQAQQEQQITDLQQTIDDLKEIQLEMENQSQSDDSSDDVKKLKVQLKQEEKRRKQAEQQSRRAEILQRERDVQESAVEILGEELEELRQENEALKQQVSEYKSAKDNHDQATNGNGADESTVGPGMDTLRDSIDSYVEQFNRLQLDQDSEWDDNQRDLFDGMRNQILGELEQVRGKLNLSDQPAGERDVDGVAAVQAYRQEVETQRLALREKDQQLSAAQNECRNLEDAIEDRDLEIDQLRKELEFVVEKGQSTDLLGDTQLVSGSPGEEQGSK